MQKLPPFALVQGLKKLLIDRWMKTCFCKSSAIELSQICEPHSHEEPGAHRFLTSDAPSDHRPMSFDPTKSRTVAAKAPAGGAAMAGGG